MRCPRCQHENPPQAKFCLECGAQFAAACVQCGTQLPAGAKFCLECGKPTGTAGTEPARFASPQSYPPKHLAEKTLSSKAALEGERKQVTVLFADLKGSMELLADRDPEEARKILDPVLERMIEAVHRYEGTVNQVMGDGSMALFGAPQAHEDHAVRACYAALRMQESVKRYAEELRRAEGVLVQIRVGLNSGEVVVRSIASDLHVDYTAVGQTTHRAARMEQLAPPGTVRLTGETARLAEGYVEVRSLGPILVKGLLDTIEIFELTGAGQARTRLQAAALRGLTRLVGRDAEVEQLRRVLGQAGAGHGQVVAIVGEAGVGKSRLTYEFIHSHRMQDWLILEASSVSYGKATSYLPVIDLLKGYFKIGDRDDQRDMRAKVLGRVLGLNRALEFLLPPLLALLDVPVEDAVWQTMDPTRRRQRTLDAVKRLLLRESQVQPLLVVFEDLHWVDGETQALLDSLADSLGSARLLLLVNYRPEYQHAWGGKTYYRQLRIDPLPPESADELLDALLGPDEALGPLKQLLVEQTEANPFFLEESVRALVETAALAGERGAYRLTRPVEHLRIPATVQAILAARIDRLAPEAKRLLQAAAVIGKDVPMPLLLAIVDAPEPEVRAELTQLQASEFLYETRLFPDLEYTFKHALTHEVAYSGLLRERRREWHARIVDAIETLHRDRLAGEIERLAHHAVQGELWEKAVHYLREAGLKAAARSAPHDARGWFERALGALDALPESQSTLEQSFEIRLELRSVLGQLGESRRSQERLREAEAVAERLNDDRRRGQVCAFVTNAHSARGELDEALVTGARAREIAARLGDLNLHIASTAYLEQAHYFRGDYERAVDLATDNLATLPADGIFEHFGLPAPASVYCRVWLVESLAQLGRFTEAAEHKAEMIRLAEATHHAFTVGLAYYASATLHLPEGDWGKARASIEHAIAVARGGNVAVLLPTAVASSAWVLAQLGEASEALNRLREGEQLLQRQAARGMYADRAWAYHALSRTCLLLGRLDEARSLCDRVVESSPCHPGFAAYAPHLLGDIATRSDRFDAESGETHYGQALALAAPRGMRPSSLTATSASASSTGARASASKPKNTSPPRRRCTARWTCGSGWSRRSSR
jgi:predicted ATPase/class 3 adenylate cyclase